MQRRNIRPDLDPETIRQVEALANQCLRKLASIDEQDWSPNAASSAQINGIVIDSLCELLNGLGFEDVVQKVRVVQESWS